MEYFDVTVSITTAHAVCTQACWRRPMLRSTEFSLCSFSSVQPLDQFGRLGDMTDDSAEILF